MKKEYHNILILICLVLVFAAIIPVLKYFTQPMGFGDSLRYLEVAKTPFVLTVYHWGYRMLVPYIAAILPFDLRLNFMIISYLSFILINMTLFVWLKNEGLSGLKSFCCCLIYSFSFAGTYYIHNYAHIGLFEELLFLLGVIAIRKNKFLYLFLIILVGSFAKETFLFLVVLYSIVNLKISTWRKTTFNTLLLLILYLSIFYLIRFSNMIFISKVDFFSKLSFYEDVWLKEKYLGNIFKTTTIILIAYAVWVSLAIIGFLFADKKARLLTLFIPMAISMIVFRADLERAVAISFPAFLLLIASLFKYCNVKEVIAISFINIVVFFIYNHNLIKAHFYIPIIWLGTILFYIYLKRYRLDNKISDSLGYVERYNEG